MGKGLWFGLILGILILAIGVVGSIRWGVVNPVWFILGGATLLVWFYRFSRYRKRR